MPMASKYNKLVRDNIPKIIEDNGEKPIVKILEDSEYKKELDKKLSEEVREYLESDNIEEIADILEVIYSIIDHKKADREQVEKIRIDKKEKRGSFTKKIFLSDVKKG